MSLTKEEFQKIKDVINNDNDPMWSEKTEVFDFYNKHFLSLLDYIDKQEEIIRLLKG